MTRNKKKSPNQQPTEIPMANTDIMVITGIKMKYLSLKENEYPYQQPPHHNSIPCSESRRRDSANQVEKD